MSPPEQRRPISDHGITLPDPPATFATDPTGVEIDSTVTLKVDRVPGFATGGMAVETADRWYTAGIGANWEEAVKIA